MQKSLTLGISPCRLFCMDTIGIRIEEAMKARGMNQRQLANKLGFHPSLISQWINGKKNIDAKDLYRVAVVTDHPIQFFYSEVVPADLSSYGEILGITPAGEYEIITLRRKRSP